MGSKHHLSERKVAYSSSSMENSFITASNIDILRYECPNGVEKEDSSWIQTT